MDNVEQPRTTPQAPRRRAPLRGRPDLETLETVAGSLLLAAAYFVTGRLGMMFDPLEGVVSPIWPPAGVGLAVLFMGGLRYWPGVTLGVFLVDYPYGPTLAIAAVSAGSTLSTVVAVRILRRLGFRPTMDRVADVLALVFGAALASTLITATIGVTALYAGGVFSRDSLGWAWLGWLVGDALGDIVVAPLLFAAWTTRSRPQPYEVGARVVLLTISCTVYAVVFYWRMPNDLLNGLLEQTHWVILPLLWAAIRFGPRTTALSIAGLATVAVLGTRRGAGVFSEYDASRGYLYLQSFLGVVGSSVLLLAAALAERRRAVSLRNDFISIASHELKTPVTALALSFDNVSRSMSSVPPQAGRGQLVARALEVGRRQISRLIELVNELLDVSQVSRGQLRLQAAPVELGELVREVLNRLAADVRESGSKLELHLQPARGQWDRLRVEQVVTNLVSNALKYGAGAPIDVAVRSQEGWAVLEVRDRGIGIRRDRQHQIFEPFNRAEEVRHVAGLGLGLYITREIVRAHGGRIDVVSELGRGSTFCVELPVTSLARH